MRRIEDENLYAILGVSSSATQAEIQIAYKQRARELHPDVNKAPDAEDRFKRLGEAYAILRDEQKRARYDARGGRRRPGNARTKSRAWAHADVGFEDIRTGTDDLNHPFEDLLRRARDRRARRPTEHAVTISLGQAYTGTSVDVVVPGKVGSSPTLRVKVPPGAKTGDRLRLPEHAVVVRLRVDLGPYKLQGRDVRMDARVAPWEAALGADITVAAPHARLRLKVPPGTESHQMLRIKGQGLPAKPGRNGPPGDLYVRVVVATPRDLSPQERELFERLARISRFRPRPES